MSRLYFVTAGESHGPCLTAIVEGLPAGLPVDTGEIDRQLRRRQGGYGRGGRMAIERDRVEILGGAIGGKTTGAPLSLRVANRDWANWAERWEKGDLPSLTVPRPGHADYAGMVKYGLEDARPVLERASARETAARVAVGALARLLLAQFDVRIGSYVTEIGGVAAQAPDLPLQDLVDLAEASDVRCPDEEAARRMRAAIDKARRGGDSLGGVFEVIAVRLPVGLGSHVHWERRLDARLAAAVMSIPAIKGVEIGPAFENARRPGTQVHDEFEEVEGRILRASNRAGGIEGGMSNGQPITLRAAMKPIPTTITSLRSVDLATGEPADTDVSVGDILAFRAGSIHWVVSGNASSLDIVEFPELGTRYRGVRRLSPGRKRGIIGHRLLTTWQQRAVCCVLRMRMDMHRDADIVYRTNPAVSNDELNALFAAAWPEHSWYDFRPILKRSLAFVCAYQAERLIGFVNLAWNGGIHAFLLDTTVHPDLQRQGIGRRLVGHAAKVARERGIVWLHVDCEPQWTAFYRGCGFRHTEAGLMCLGSVDGAA